MKHTKEYAAFLANSYIKTPAYDYDGHYGSFKNGYLKAVEENNVVGLIEACKSMTEYASKNYAYHSDSFLKQIKLIESELKKAGV